MFAGVDHVGIGVADMEAALEFFGERLAFSTVLFDYTGELPGLDDLTQPFLGDQPSGRVAVDPRPSATRPARRESL